MLFIFEGNKFIPEIKRITVMECTKQAKFIKQNNFENILGGWHAFKVI